MNLTVHFFATLKDRVGASDIKIDLPDLASVDTLLSTLVMDHPAIEPFLGTTIVAVNRKFADKDRTLTPDDEIVLFPPVSGG